MVFVLYSYSIEKVLSGCELRMEIVPKLQLFVNGVVQGLL